MDIGTVVSVEIDKEEKICVIINKKYYCDLSFDNDTIPGFLTRYYGGEATNTIVVYPRKSDSIGKVLCYELMYGDSRVWILGESMFAVIVERC